MKVIDFYFDFASPYGYVAATQIDKLADDLGVRAVWHPILLGVVFKTTRMSATALQPLRKEYFFHDIQRLGRFYSLVIKIPSVLPVNALIASRIYYWMAETSPDQAKNFALLLFDLYWQQDRDIGQIEHTVAAAKSMGFSEQDVMQGSQSDASKQKLRQETNLAIEKGVFGSPFFLFGNEPFWGCDRLDQLRLWIAQGGW